MNKRLGIVFVFALLVGAVFLSACQQDAVGRGVKKAVDTGGAEKLSAMVECDLIRGPMNNFWSCKIDCNLGVGEPRYSTGTDLYTVNGALDEAKEGCGRGTQD